jgi:hypothetical protein
MKTPGAIEERTLRPNASAYTRAELNVPPCINDQLLSLASRQLRHELQSARQLFFLYF